MVFPDASQLIFRYHSYRTKIFRTPVASRAIILALRKHMARAGQEEVEHVLSCRYPGAFVVDLAMEINGAEFAEYPIVVAAVLSGFSARPLAHFLFLLTGSVGRAARAREPGTGVHLGHGNTIPATEEDHSTRDGERSINRWGTSKRANRLHRCRHRAIALPEQQKPAGQAKGRDRTWGGW